MTKLLIIKMLGLFVGLSYSQTIVINLETISNSLSKGIEYLKGIGGPNKYDALQPASIGVAQLLLLLKTDNSMSKDMRQKVEKYYEQLNEMVENTLSQILYEENRIPFVPANYLVDYDFSFGVHNILNLGPLPITSHEIYVKSHYSVFERNCVYDIIASDPYPEMRKCNIKPECMTYMETPYKGLVENRTVDARFEFLDTERIFNCTNTPKKKRDALITTACTFMLREVNSVVIQPFEPAVLHVFLSKIVNCGGHGFSQFLADYIVLYVLRLQQANGSFGREDFDEYALNIFTSEGVAIMASCLREKITMGSLTPPYLSGI